MNNINEGDLPVIVIAIVGLFAAPVGLFIGLYILVCFFSGKENFSDWGAQSRFGFFLMLTITPIAFWASINICKEKLGWFRRK